MFKIENVELQELNLKTAPYGNGKLQTARGNLVYDANYNAADNTFRGTNSNFGEGHYSTPSGNVIFHANYEAADRNFDHKPHALKKDKSLYELADDSLVGTVEGNNFTLSKNGKVYKKKL